MTLSTNSTESKIPLPTSSGEGNSSTNTTVDDFGYDSDPIPTPSASEANTPNNTDPIPAPSANEGDEGQEVKNKATGYGDIPKPTEPPVVPPKTEPKEGDPAPTDEEKVTEALNGLPDSIDKEKLSKFVKDNKMSPEQIKAYGDLVKAEEAESVKNREKFVAEQRANWQAELKADKDFGGENFTLNVDRVEKVLEKHFPNMKKELTTRGTMLPPYIMKDFLGLWNTMNPTQKLVEGDPIVPKSDKHYLEEMYE